MKEKIVKQNEDSIVNIAYKYEEKRFKNGEIKSNSYVRLKQTIKTVGTYKFANIPIQRVTRRQVENFLENERIKADETLKKEFRLIKKAFELASKKQIITNNFFTGNDPIKRPSSYKKTTKVDALSRQEEFLLTEYLKHNYSKYKNIILLALYTRYENWRGASINARRY